MSEQMQTPDRDGWQLLADLFEANERPQDWSFPHGDAGGMDALVTTCAFCYDEKGHTVDCPWEAARRALERRAGYSNVKGER